VFTKMDLLGEDEAPPLDAPDAFGVFAISAAGRTGLEPLLAAWWSRLLDMKKASVKRDESIPLP
jgi:GTP-binding protein